MNKLIAYKLLRWIFLGLSIAICLITTLLLFLDKPITTIIVLYTIGSIFILLFATFYILQIILEEKIKNPKIKNQKEKKKRPIKESKQKTQALDINTTHQTIQKEKQIKQKSETNNKATKKKDNFKIIYYIFLVLSIINLVIGLILLNIPLLYMLVIPTILTFFALSIVTYLIAKSIKNKIHFNAIIETIKNNQNRE